MQWKDRKIHIIHIGHSSERELFIYSKAWKFNFDSIIVARSSHCLNLFVGQFTQNTRRLFCFVVIDVQSQYKMRIVHGWFIGCVRIVKKNHRVKTPTLFSAPNNNSSHSQMCWQIIHARKWDFFLPNSIYSMINSSNYMAFISSALCALWNETMAFYIIYLFIHKIRRQIGSDFSISFWCINFGWYANFSYSIH